MFGNMLGDMQERQKEMQKKLAGITVKAESPGGAVKVTANAARQLVDIQIDREALDWDDLEMVQDLILAAVNKALEKAAETEQAETQNLVKDMLPPGMGDLGKLFGQ